MVHSNPNIFQAAKYILVIVDWKKELRLDSHPYLRCPGKNPIAPGSAFC